MPKINPMIAIAIIRGTAAMMSAKSGTKSSVIESMIGYILEFRSALAYWTRPSADTDAIVSFTLAVPRYPAAFVFRSSKDVMFFPSSDLKHFQDSVQNSKNEPDDRKRNYFHASKNESSPT